MSYARKAMIRCGLVLEVNDTWNTNQLFPHLQEIIAFYFEALEVPELPST